MNIVTGDDWKEQVLCQTRIMESEIRTLERQVFSRNWSESTQERYLHISTEICYKFVAPRDRKTVCKIV